MICAAGLSGISSPFFSPHQFLQFSDLTFRASLQQVAPHPMKTAPEVCFVAKLIRIEPLDHLTPREAVSQGQLEKGAVLAVPILFPFGGDESRRSPELVLQQLVCCLDA